MSTVLKYRATRTYKNKSPNTFVFDSLFVVSRLVIEPNGLLLRKVD